MKRLVFLCLALTGLNTALAQQPAEWRPNVAEDNKSATWENTVTFMKGILETSHNTTIPGQSELFLKTFDSAKHCQIGMTAGERNGGDPLIVDKMEIDFGRIDPLSIDVVPVQTALSIAMHRTPST